jgi:hypothetical protein
VAVPFYPILSALFDEAVRNSDHRGKNCMVMKNELEQIFFFNFVTWLMLLSQNCLDGYVENQNFSQDSR